MLFYSLSKIKLFIVVVCIVSMSALPVLADDITSRIVVEDTQCTDGLDNDGDLLIDFPSDPGCESTLDDDETDPVLPQCQDGLDNDGDSLFDYPADLGCASAVDDDESDDPAPPSSGGGGGGGVSNRNSDPETTVSGYAYPGSEVAIMVDGVVVTTVIANEEAKFEVLLEGVDPGIHVVSFLSSDSLDVQSNADSVTIEFRSDTSLAVSQVFIPPSITLDKVAVATVDTLTVTGETVPFSLVRYEVHSEDILTGTTTAQADGYYSFTIPVTALAQGDHTVKVEAIIDGVLESGFSKAIRFAVGDQSVARADGCDIMADLNADCGVDLVDFSILAYWWGRELSTDFAALEQDKLSGDGLVRLNDLSIMAYHWTGVY